MIGHIVMWNFEERHEGRGKAENLALLAERFAALRPQIQGLREMTFGINYNESDAACDAVLQTVFETPEDLAAYDAHPEHQKIRTFIRAFATERRVADYVI